MWPTEAGISTDGSQVAGTGLPAQPTAFETVELLETSQVLLESAPPRLAGFWGAAKSLPFPIQIVPVPRPVTFGKRTLCAALVTTAPVAAPGLSTTKNDPIEVMLLVVTPP